MKLLKRFDRTVIRERYRIYRLSSFVYAAVFFVSFLLGAVLTTMFVQTAKGIDLCEFFRLHWTYRLNGIGVFSFAVYEFCLYLPYLLCALVFGITVYAPLVGGIGGATASFFAGAYLRLILGHASQTGVFRPFFLYLPGVCLMLLVLCALFAFSCACSLKIFSPPAQGKREDEQMFGGSLFCGPYFENRINLRFLFSYLACFFAGAILLFLLCLMQGALLSRL